MTTALCGQDAVAATLAAYARTPARYAAGWDAFDPSTDASIDLVAELTRDLPAGALVVDVGSGSGRDLARLRTAGFAALGVDACPELATLADRRGPVIVADMRALPLPDASVDAVLAAASLLHLPASLAPTAAGQLARVLRPGGRLVVSVKAGDGPTADRDARFFHLYTDAALDALLAGAGFTVTHRARDTDSRGTVWLIRTAHR